MQLVRKKENPILNLYRIRKDFPILKKKINRKRLVYLDNAATTQKPIQVIERMDQFYSSEYSNVHRGLYSLSQIATELYEESRKKVARFLNAKEDREIIFVRGATEAINLVAASFGRKFIQAGDEILVSQMEHHSNIVPWQLMCEQTGAKIKVIPINEQGEILMEEYEKRLSSKTRLVAITHVSNALGTVNPLAEIIKMAHEKGAKVLVDGAQAVPHFPVDVTKLDCDFYAFSGHKVFGPSGIGVLYGKAELLESMPPYQGGGDMIRSVTFEKTTFNSLPYKFEAGTPNVAGVVGLGATIDYLNHLDWQAVMRHEEELLNEAKKELQKIPGLKIVGQAKHRVGAISFTLKGIHPHDVATILDSEGIAIRAGHHCTQPLMDFFGVPATIRASFAFYNTHEEVNRLIEGINKTIRFFV